MFVKVVEERGRGETGGEHRNIGLVEEDVEQRKEEEEEEKDEKRLMQKMMSRNTGTEERK